MGVGVTGVGFGMEIIEGGDWFKGVLVLRASAALPFPISIT